MDLSSFRKQFRFPDEPDAVELRSFTHGLQPATVPRMMEHFTEDWRRFGVDAWNEVPNHWRPESGDPVGWWTLPTYLGDEFIAPLLNAPEETCILQPTVHWTVQCLLSTPEVRERGSEIILSETAFPSILHSVQQWANLRSFAPQILPPTSTHRLDQEAILDAITEETALVALSQVGFTTGARLTDDFLQRLANHAHEHDALVLLDGYHAVGSMPVDVTTLGCDLYVGGLLKEGCGASGNTFLYVREDLELTPRLTGWFGDASPFEFCTEPTPHPDVRRRFLGGTTAVAPMYHAVEGIRCLLECGLERIRSHSLALSELAITRADEADIPLRSPRERPNRCAMVLLEVPEAQQMTSYLKRRDVYTDSRQNEVVRMAPFLWNTEEDIHRTFDLIEHALSSGIYREYREASGPVP